MQDGPLKENLQCILVGLNSLLRYYSVVYIMAKCLMLKASNSSSLNLSFAAVRNVYQRLLRAFSTGNV